MTGYLAAGVALGLYAGISPGPLTTLIIAESLRGGWPAGFRVALAPLITDSLLVTMALLLIAPMPAWGLASVGLVGGLILVWMGWSTVRLAWSPAGATATGAETGGERSALFRGVVTNLLNPHAILFWITNGAPLLREAAGHGWAGPSAFLVPFFSLLVGTKVLIALIVATGRRFLQTAGYRLLLGGSGPLLRYSVSGGSGRAPLSFWAVDLLRRDAEEAEQVFS